MLGTLEKIKSLEPSSFLKASRYAFDCSHLLSPEKIIFLLEGIHQIIGDIFV